jgi:uncharacterized spore protein YtfJ
LVIPGRPFAAIRRVLRARDVFGKPVKSDGVTVIPVASVFGGGGAGGGERGADPDADRPAGAEEVPQSGGGLGFGFWARPVGAFVIRDGKVRWRSALDGTSLVLGAMLAVLVLARWMLRNR